MATFGEALRLPTAATLEDFEHSRFPRQQLRGCAGRRDHHRYTGTPSITMTSPGQGLRLVQD